MGPEALKVVSRRVCEREFVVVCVWGGVQWDCVQENKYETHPGPRWRMCMWDCGSFTAQCSICEVGLWIMAKKNKIKVYKNKEAYLAK